jgi:hypothetical protein
MVMEMTSFYIVSEAALIIILFYLNRNKKDKYYNYMAGALILDAVINGINIVFELPKLIKLLVSALVVIMFMLFMLRIIKEANEVFEDTKNMYKK